MLLAGRYTLLDRSGAALLDTCAARGVGVIIGGVFNSGILARVDAEATFDYELASRVTRERADALGRACERNAVPLPAAALDFALRNPAVSAVVVGARSANEIRDDVAWAQSTVPQSLRDDLDAAPQRW